MLLSFNPPSQAVEIRVAAPGLVGPGLVTLENRWNAETGNKAIVPDPVSVSKIEQQIQAGDSYDLVLLPHDDLTGIAGKLRAGSEKPVGRVVFALAVSHGAPHPDISTPAKFRAALAGKIVAYNDPALGSIGGKMVGTLLKQPAYAGVKGFPFRGPAADAVVAGKADMVVGVQSEEVIVKGVDIVGPVPDGVGLTLAISGAVLADALYPEEAAAFLTYLTRPQSATVWEPTGIAMIRP